MAARRRATARPDPHRWIQVRSHLRCANGHDVASGAWVRYGRPGIPMCEDCLRTRYGILRPARPFVFTGDPTVDVKDRQSGGDV